MVVKGLFDLICASQVVVPVVPLAIAICPKTLGRPSLVTITGLTNVMLGVSLSTIVIL